MQYADIHPDLPEEGRGTEFEALAEKTTHRQVSERCNLVLGAT